RNAPYAEETQYVIDAKCIEVITHLSEALFPPCESILLHALPVVGWELPVLSHCGEVIRRSSGLRIHVIHFRRHPCIATIPVDSYGNIALQHNTFSMRIVRCFLQLQMQMKLHEAIE